MFRIIEKYHCTNKSIFNLHKKHYRLRELKKKISNQKYRIKSSENDYRIVKKGVCEILSKLEQKIYFTENLEIGPDSETLVVTWA